MCYYKFNRDLVGPRVSSIYDSIYHIKHAKLKAINLINLLSPACVVASFSQNDHLQSAYIIRKFADADASIILESDSLYSTFCKQKKAAKIGTYQDVGEPEILIGGLEDDGLPEEVRIAISPSGSIGVSCDDVYENVSIFISKNGSICEEEDDIVVRTRQQFLY